MKEALAICEKKCTTDGKESARRSARDTLKEL